MPLNAEGARLPDLTITKFNGTYQAWLPFWNKFVAEVDSADLAPVYKFCKFKGIRPKVRVSIGLPFTNEGYVHAKNIQTEYGKQSEIVNANISNIMGLSVISVQIHGKLTSFTKHWCTMLRV